MDFGDILEQWDEMQKNAAKQKKDAAQVSHKRRTLLQRKKKLRLHCAAIQMSRA